MSGTDDSGVVSEHEVLDWFDAGRTYQWMVEEHARKYGRRVMPTVFGELGRRAHPDRQAAAPLPWHVRPEHRRDLDFEMLRLERRRRSGHRIPTEDVPRLDAWVAHLQRHRLVVDYDPHAGFSLVHARPSDGDGLVRRAEPVARSDGAA